MWAYPSVIQVCVVSNSVPLHFRMYFLNAYSCLSFSDIVSLFMEDVPTGELPRNMLLSVDRHLVQTIAPGTRLTIMGIYSIYQAANSAA